MFDIYGDDIVLEGVKVGRLEGAWPTLRDRAEDYLRGTLDGYVIEDDHLKACDEAREEGYQVGKEEGYAEYERDEKQKYSLEEALALLKSQGYEVSKRK